MHISIDGFVSTKNDSANFNWDKDIMRFSVDNLKKVDTILLGRNTAEGFIPHWAGVAKDKEAIDHKVGKLLTEIPKVVFSKKLRKNKWDNTTIANGDIAKEINALKKKNGKDIIVYGGYTFVSSLISKGLVDEYYLLVNLVAVGSGGQIFADLKSNLHLTLKKCEPFDCGTVLLRYTRRK